MNGTRFGGYSLLKFRWSVTTTTINSLILNLKNQKGNRKKCLQS